MLVTNLEVSVATSKSQSNHPFQKSKEVCQPNTNYVRFDQGHDPSGQKDHIFLVEEMVPKIEIHKSTFYFR